MRRRFPDDAPRLTVACPRCTVSPADCPHPYLPVCWAGIEINYNSTDQSITDTMSRHLKQLEVGNTVEVASSNLAEQDQSSKAGQTVCRIFPTSWWRTYCSCLYRRHYLGLPTRALSLSGTYMCPLTCAPLNNYLEGVSHVLRELCELVHHEVVHVDKSLEGRNHVERW